MDLQEIIALTQELIKIPSENPPGNEREIAGFVYNWFEQNGLSTQVIEVKSNRPNIIAKIKGNGERPPLVILAHMDTVPAGEGWVEGPFAGNIVDGKIIGRGAADMKSGLASAMVSIRNIYKLGKDLHGDLYVVATIDEEGPDMLGAQALLDTDFINKDTMIIATEPTGLDLCCYNKGILWYQIETFGISSHAGNPHKGADAIYGMSVFLTNAKYKIKSLNYNHSYLGKPTVTIGKIEGGSKVNVVPDYCQVHLDLRIVPPMTINQADLLLEDVLRESLSSIPNVKGKIRRFGLDRPPFEALTDSLIAKSLSNAYQDEMGKVITKIGFPGYTDSTIIGSMLQNKNCIVFGPARLEQAHTIGEYVDIDELKKSEKILTKTILSALSGS